MNLSAPDEALGAGARLESTGVRVVIGFRGVGPRENGEEGEGLGEEAVVDVGADHDVEEDDVAASVGSFVEQVAGSGWPAACGVGAHEADGGGGVGGRGELGVEEFEGGEGGWGAALIDGVEEEREGVGWVLGGVVGGEEAREGDLGAFSGSHQLGGANRMHIIA